MKDKPGELQEILIELILRLPGFSNTTHLRVSVIHHFNALLQFSTFHLCQSF